MTEERAILVQRMIAAWNENCNVSTSDEDHMAAALDVALAWERARALAESGKANAAPTDEPLAVIEGEG
jgi:hypothetical protein